MTLAEKIIAGARRDVVRGRAGGHVGEAGDALFVRARTCASATTT